jgi:predicted outer membrane lipoprotein
MLIDNRATYAQILTVPILLAVFACAFAIIRALV